MLEFMYHPDCLQLSVSSYVWVAWKSSGNGMMLVHRYVCAVTEFVLSIGKVSMVGDNILTLYMAANCLHLPMPSLGHVFMSKGYAGTPPVPTYNIHSLLHKLGVHTVNHLSVACG